MRSSVFLASQFQLELEDAQEREDTRVVNDIAQAFVSFDQIQSEKIEHIVENNPVMIVAVARRDNHQCNSITMLNAGKYQRDPFRNRDNF